MNNPVVLYAHGSAYNHGCEAIVRSTVNLLSLKKEDTILYSDNIDGDLAFGINNIVTVKSPVETPVNSSSFLGILYRAKAHFSNNHDLTYRLCHGKHQYAYLLNPCKVALSIGGDNYCYRGGISSLIVRNYWLHKKGIPTVLWGASLMKEFITSDLIDDLNRYSLIVAREQVTYDLLQSLHLKTSIIQAPDPAFTLLSESTAWPDGKEHQSVIGINISPYVKLRAANSSIGIENYCRLIRWILNETDSEIALVPHVVFPNSENNDINLQTELLERLDYHGERILTIPPSLNCCQLKSVISKCDMFVGARTHATIAAYSSLVPTLVVGYSSKSVGIARDLFGTDSGYVVPVQAINDSNELAKAFSKLYSDRCQIKKHLSERLPLYLSAFENCVDTMRTMLG